jgi:K+-transporting ATPase ATPase C chain
MREHLRACLWLLGFTVVLCAVLYPLTLLGIGQALFHNKAQGSLVTDKEGKVVGSELIAQNFTGDGYFWPRPSAASYNAAASGASNWGANNPLLRNRVARQLGPIVFYAEGADAYGKKPGDAVGPDVEKWFKADRYKGKSGIVAQWLKRSASVAEAWVKDTGDALKEQTGTATPGAAFAGQWNKDFPQRYAEWYRANPDKDDPTPADLSKPFFEGFIKDHPGAWPYLDEVTVGDKKVKKLVPIRDEKDDKKKAEIQAAFFDMWRSENADIPLEPVPADLVMASGSGLDPHITLDNALYQLRHRIAVARADKIIEDRKLSKSRRAAIQKQIEDDLVKLLDEHASAPLWGLAGVPLVNVLKVNLALDARVQQLANEIK